MKIITFWGGLGNQMFEYAYYLWLKEKFPNENIYGYYPAVGLSDHNGLEVDKRFKVKLPPSNLYIKLLGNVLFNINRVCRKLGLSEIATCTMKNEKFDAIFHCDYWQNKKYIPKSMMMEFDLGKLNSLNAKLLSEIENNSICSIHIRRGDYLKKKNALIYGGICTEDYYKRAIDEIVKETPNVKLLFFSDDSQYVRKTYKYQNMQIVDWNKGENSILDMYLMSKCKYMILANSTFSYWAAILNKSAKIIICPTQWKNFDSPDIIADDWVKIK